MLQQIVLLIIIAALWGCTNPFIKKGAKDISKVQSTNVVYQFLLELKYLFTNYKYLVPMVLNQCGSILYFLALQNVDLSLAVPVANSLTFLFTALVGWLLGEQTADKNTYIGMSLVLIGTTFCYLDKIS